MRGTLTASEMAQKDRIPSGKLLANESEKGTGKCRTKSSYDLRLQAELALEARGNVAHPTTSVASDIRHLANVVKHVSTGEEKDRDQADGSPDVAVLNNGQNIG